jgi:hypothetical protein
MTVNEQITGECFLCSLMDEFAMSSMKMERIAGGCFLCSLVDELVTPTCLSVWPCDLLIVLANRVSQLVISFKNLQQILQYNACAIHCLKLALVSFVIRILPLLKSFCDVFLLCNSTG